MVNPTLCWKPRDQARRDAGRSFKLPLPWGWSFAGPSDTAPRARSV